MLGISRVRYSKMPWVETSKTIQSEHKNPQNFQPQTLKTINLNEAEGIQAVVGKPMGKETQEIQSYLFSKDKGWTLKAAQEWFEKHFPGAKEHVYAVLPFVIAEKILDKPLRIQGVAMTTGISRNFNIYTPEELQAFASKLLEAPVYLEHVTAQDAVGKVTKTQWDGQNLLYEAEIYDEETAAKIRKGLIKHVSVGADYEAIDLVNGKVPHGLYNAEMSLVAVPGVPQTNIEIIEKLHLKEQETLPIIAGEYTLGFYQDIALFMPEHYSTVWLNRENGILAIMGKPRSQPDLKRTQAIYFSQEKRWDQNKIRDWLQLHPTYLTPILETQAATVAEGFFKKPAEPTIPVSQAIRLIEAVLPSHLVQRSWSLGPQRMCQELTRVLFKLRGMQDSHKVDRK
jgi:hypothetical protein